MPIKTDTANNVCPFLKIACSQLGVYLMGPGVLPELIGGFQ